MSLLKDFSPKRTRKKQSESRGSNTKLPEVREGLVKEITSPEETQALIKEYSYKPESAQKEQKPPAQKEQNKDPKINCPSFGFFELMTMCEEHLRVSLYGPQDIKFKKIHSLNKKIIFDKLNIMANKKKEVHFNAFIDTMFYYKNEVLITEEYLSLTGFLREYFDIEKVAVLYNTGEILLIETGYCNFWFKDRLKKFFDGRAREISHTEILDDDNCLDCMFNWNCPFSRVQQKLK